MGAGSKPVVDRRRHGRGAGAPVAVGVPCADGIDAGDVAHHGAPRHGDRPAVVQTQEGGGVRPSREPDAEQALAPVDRELEGVAEHVAGRQHAFHVGDAQSLVSAVGANDVAGVRDMTGTTPEGTKPRSLATSAASAATGEAAYSPPGRSRRRSTAAAAAMPSATLSGP